MHRSFLACALRVTRHSPPGLSTHSPSAQNLSKALRLLSNVPKLASAPGMAVNLTRAMPSLLEEADLLGVEQVHASRHSCGRPRVIV